MARGGVVMVNFMYKFVPQGAQISPYFYISVTFFNCSLYIFFILLYLVFFYLQRYVLG